MNSPATETIDVGPAKCPACGVPFTDHAGVTPLCRQVSACKAELTWLLALAQANGSVDEDDITMALRRAELSTR